MSVEQTRQVLETYWRDHDPRFVADGKGVLEARVVGRHTGEFGGVPATGRDVNVPLCVVYDVVGGYIARARIYLQVNVLMQQIS